MLSVWPGMLIGEEVHPVAHEEYIGLLCDDLLPLAFFEAVGLFYLIESRGHVVIVMIHFISLFGFYTLRTNGEEL